MASATEIAESVRAGRRRASEVVEESLRRIAAGDASIGAFQVVDADGARAGAAELDQVTDKQALPLAGVPVAIKDNIDVAGLPTRHGSAASSTTPAAADDELVRRLRQAGAIVVGKTRLPELAIWHFTESALGGTRNPRSPDRNAGGSTGGGAAAVAAGMVPLALGSDGGGSLRIPAANCGVIGYKPATGTVPIAGGLAEHWFGNSAFGPIATTVADIVTAMGVLAGAPWSLPQPRALRIAVATNRPIPTGAPDAAARTALSTAVAALQRLGHTTTPVTVPYGQRVSLAWIACWLAGVAQDVEVLGLPVERLEPRTRWMVRRGRWLLRRYGADLDAVRRRQRDWQARAAEFLSSYDVLLTPAVARPAPPFGFGATAGFWASFNNGSGATPYTQAWNLSGFPAMSLPCGQGAVQLVALPGHEATQLGLAAELHDDQPSTSIS